MIETDIKGLIHTYLEKYYLLQSRGGASRDGDLYQEVALLEKQLLRSFGLPRSNRFSNFVWKIVDSTPSDVVASTLYTQLAQEAGQYLSSHPRTFNQLLSQARLSKADPFEVLPEILIGANSYTLFIYNEILLKNIDTEENVMNEYEVIRKRECLTEIYRLTQIAEWEVSELFNRLVSYGLRYLPRYMSWFEMSHPQIDTKEVSTVNEKSGALKNKVDEVCFLLNLAYKQYLKLLNQGFDETRAKKLTGLSDSRSFYLAYTIYHHS